jgi:hypothetical protein
VESSDGSQAWWRNGKRHREDGPAVIFPCGSTEYWIKDECMTLKEFNARNDPKEYTMDQVAAALGVDVDKLKIKK